MPDIVSVKKLGGRTAIVGCGSRGQLFLRGVVDRISNPANKVVAFCDVNEGRVKYYNRLLQELGQPVRHGVLKSSRESDQLTIHFSPETGRCRVSPRRIRTDAREGESRGSSRHNS